MHNIYIKKGQQGLNTSSLIGNTAIQQPNIGYQPWMSTMQKLPLLNQNFNTFNPNMNYQNYLQGGVGSFASQAAGNMLGNVTQSFSNALGQSMDAIAQNSSSPVARGIAVGVKGLGQHIIGSVGSSVSQSVGKEIGAQLGKAVLKGGLKNVSAAGIGSAAKAGFTSGLKGALNAKSLGGVALSIANQFAPQKREYSGDKGQLTKSLDSAYDTLSDAVSVIPGFGTAASLIMKGGALAGKFVNKWGGGTDGMTSTDAILGSNFLNLTPLGLVNGFGGNNAYDFNYNTAKDRQERAYVAGDYDFSTIDAAAHKSGKKYGFFSQGARNKANEQITKGNLMADRLKGISQTANFRNTFGNAMTDVNSVKYQNSISGNNSNLYTPTGKQGMKIEKQTENEFIIPDISNFKPIIASEEEVQKFKEGGSFNIIPEGALHARKNNMEVENITKKGIPVVDKDGVQQAEIERDEIIFRKEVTDAIEEARKDGSDKKAIEIGKLLVKEIFHNTQDNTGLIEDLTNETPTVKEQVENHEVFPVEKKENGGLIDQINNMDLTKLNSIEKDTLLQLLLQKASL